MSCQRAIQIDVAAFLVEPDRPEWASFRDHYPSCPDCAAAIAAWSRLEQGLRTPPASRPESGAAAHPEPALLVRYAEARDSLGAEAAALSFHLASCPTCATELRALQRFDWGRLAPTSEPRERDERSLAGRIAAWLGLDSIGLLIPIAAGVAIVLGLGIWIGLRGPVAPSGERPAMPPTAETSPMQRAPDSETTVPAIDDARELAEAEPEMEGAAQDEPRGERAVAEAEGPEPTRPDEAEPLPGEILIAAIADLPPPEYALPPGAEMLGWQRELGAVRSGAGANVRVETQAPDHVGLTSKASPRLWWSLDRATDHALVFTLSNDRDIDPVLRVELPGPRARGLASIDLASFGVELEPGTVHRWFVTVELDPEDPARNPISGAAIERLEPGDARVGGLADVPASRRGHDLARRGLWYDAYDFFAELAEANPENLALQAHRDALAKGARASD